jgi:hypothetical protein
MLLILLIMAVLGPSMAISRRAGGDQLAGSMHALRGPGCWKSGELDYIETLGRSALGMLASCCATSCQHPRPQLVLLTRPPRLVVMEASVGFLASAQPPPLTGQPDRRGISFLLNAQWLVVYPDLPSPPW